MRCRFVEIVLFPEDDVLCGEWNAVEINELGGEDEPFSIAVAVKEQDLFILILA